MGQVQPVFQNPFEAFNPLSRIDEYLFATAHRFAGADTPQRKHAIADEVLQRVGLSMAEISRAGSRTNCPAASCSASRWRAR